MKSLILAVFLGGAACQWDGPSCQLDPECTALDPKYYGCV